MSKAVQQCSLSKKKMWIELGLKGWHSLHLLLILGETLFGSNVPSIKIYLVLHCRKSQFKIHQIYFQSRAVSLKVKWFCEQIFLPPAPLQKKRYKKNRRRSKWYSPILKIVLIAKTISMIINKQNWKSLRLGRTYARIFVLGHYLFLKARCAKWRLFL